MPFSPGLFPGLFPWQIRKAPLCTGERVVLFSMGRCTAVLLLGHDGNGSDGRGHSGRRIAPTRTARRGSVCPVPTFSSHDRGNGEEARTRNISVAQPYRHFLFLSACTGFRMPDAHTTSVPSIVAIISPLRQHAQTGATGVSSVFLASHVMFVDLSAILSGKGQGDSPPAGRGAFVCLCSACSGDHWIRRPRILGSCHSLSRHRQTLAGAGPVARRPFIGVSLMLAIVCRLGQAQQSLPAWPQGCTPDRPLVSGPAAPHRVTRSKPQSMQGRRDEGAGRNDRDLRLATKPAITSNL